MKTTRTLAISAILGFAFAFCASAKVVYDDEFTNAWFNVVAASANLDDTTHWKKPDDGEAKRENSRIKLDTDLDDPLTYDPKQRSAEVAIVTARFQATANTGVPELGGNGPQAALTVIANGADTNWYGLVKGESANVWIKFENVIPVVGQEYDIQIEFDLRQDSKRIRYSADGVVLGNGWYGNPQQTATFISTVSFSGTGDIGDFAGSNVVARTPVATVTGTDQVDGCDYTNGTLQVNLNAAAAGSATLKVIDFKTGAVVATYDGQAFGAGTGSVSWDVAKAVSGQALVPGGTYGYEVTITASSTGQAASQPVVKTGTFTAASTTDESWFYARVADDHKSVFGGDWTNAVEISQGAYQIDDGAYFEIDDSTKGANNLTRVDADVIFESMVDAATLVVEDDALGGFVAAKEGDANVWKALSKNGDKPAWVTLSGAIAPEANMQYVIRAEVSFIENYKKVRYLVSADNGENFSVLADTDGKQWIPLAAEKTTLVAVELKGSGTLASLTGGITDRALAEVGGVKYYSMAEALADAKGSDIITLLTNVTLAPTVAGRWTFSDKNKIKGIDLSGVSRSRARWDGNTLIVETSLGATYLIW